MPSTTTIDEPDAAPRDAEWTVRARRLAPLVDGIEYFRAVRSAILAARRQVLIVGWEIHSEFDLLRGREADEATERDGAPVRFADLLEHVVEARPDLEIRLLVWEGASLFALERQHLPRMKRPWARHPRIRLVWDGDVPPLGSQHQKFVVIDDRVAFAGGMDLTKSRWDAHEHRLGDERRRLPGLLPRLIPGAVPERGDPYHDLMLAVDGPAAATLGAWGRERWRRATGETLEAPDDAAARDDAPDPWPSRLEPMLRDRDVGIALTEPDVDGRAGKRQVETAFVEQIGRARELVYVETQYLAAEIVVDAMVERLRERDGPAIVLVMPYGCPGRVQSMAMDSRRDAMLDRLREADPGGRFAAYWPTLGGPEPEEPFAESIYVHAKALVIDDRLLRIGSANMNGRSMGLDTELDCTVEVPDDDEAAVDAIAGVRRRLLSYLLGEEAGRIAVAERHHGSLVAAIESLRGGERSLQPFAHRVPPSIRRAALELPSTDPDRPIDAGEARRALEAIARAMGRRERWQRRLAVLVERLRPRRPGRTLGALAAALLVPAIAWWGGRLVDPAQVESLLETARSGPAGIVGAAALFAVLGAAGVPVTVLVAATGAVLGPWRAIATCLAGVLASASVGFAVGRLAPDRWRERWRGTRAGGLLERVRDRGVVSVATLRNLPVAPYAVVNLGLGLAGVHWPAYLAGTAIGMLPGIVLLAVFGAQLGALAADPSPGRVALALGILAATIGAAIGGQRIADRLRRGRADDANDDAADRAAVHAADRGSADEDRS